MPEYNPEELQKAYVGAGVLLGALGGATLGTAGGFAAAGATTAAVTALGSASTRYCNCKSFRSSCRQMQHWHF